MRALDMLGRLSSSFSQMPLAVHYLPQRVKELKFTSPDAAVHKFVVDFTVDLFRSRDSRALFNSYEKDWYWKGLK